MDSIRHSVEASFARPREVIMEERYRRLHYDPTAAPHYWAHAPSKAVALGRFRRHLPVVPKKKSKDSKRGEHVEIPVYPYKDKYGSVSAHSTSAIYGALRAPHYHAICGPQDMWYASVRSLNRGIHRDVVYTAETYEWRETVYEEAPKEVFAVGPPPVEMIPRPPCMCVVRRRHPLEGASLSKSSRILPRCKICAPPAISNGSLNNGQSSSKRASGTPEKIKSPILEEKVEPKVESTSRMSGYKKFITGSKFKTPFKGISTKESRKISRKSILECDVTAYDLIKKVAKTPTVPEIDDSDIDDNLNDNAIAKINHAKRNNYENKPKLISPSNGSPRHAGINKRSTKFIKSQSENCIYSESQSVLVGGQRIFTDNHRSKSPTLAGNLNSGDEQEDMGNHLQYAKWRHLSVSDESVSIPDPDYDFSDDSDDGTVINSNYMDPKFTYSPPPIRKSINDSHGLDYGSRELSKSMSSLQSDDTFVPSINLNKPNSSMWVSKPNDCDTLENDIEIDCLSKAETSEDEANLDDRPTSPSNALDSKQDSKYESSSDCSSSGGTLSSDYPTWTSSSSNELKSILKNKKRRENLIKEAKDSSKLNKHLDESKASQKKKQVQFQPGCSDTATAMDNAKDDGNPFNKEDDDSDTNLTAVINDIYETVAEATCDKSIQNGEMAADSFDSSRGAYVSVNNPFTVDECIDSLVACHIDKHNLPISSIKNCSTSNLDLPEGILSPEGKQTSLPPSLPPKLPPGRSSSLEDIRNGSQGGRDKKSKRSRTTLPKRRLSDLHLHSLLCPTRSSFCGNGSSSDDMPLTSATQRAHRSLPESPNELDEVSSFCFDFLEKGSKDKVLSSSRSVFYIPVDGDAQKSELNDSPAGNSSTEGPAGAAVVSPSIEDDGNQSFPKEEPLDACDMDGNVSTEHYDTDEDNLENDYENLDPIYEELSEVSNSAKRMWKFKIFSLLD